MPLRSETLDDRLANLDTLIGGFSIDPSGAIGAAVDRFRADLAALRFHLDEKRNHLPLVAVIGGTGTGKSTLVNRLLDANVCGTHFRRTFTSGAIAVANAAAAIPDGWLNVDKEAVTPTAAGPVRGVAGKLTVIALDGPLTREITLIDTPDLDGDQPQHHAEADRVFRWAEALLFLVTPEKYQMTELLPYYRLARRYALPALFVMNKCEEEAVLEDFQRQLSERDWADARIFALPRDDAAYQPPPEADLSSLRNSLISLNGSLHTSHEAISNRTADLLDRLRDRIIAPLQRERAQIDELIPRLRMLETPAPGVDVGPLTQQLQRRLQQQSILYLMGPQRMLDRVRQVPGMLLRMPRTLWDVIMKGESLRMDAPGGNGTDAAPDFRALLVDQFRIVQSRIDDQIRTVEVSDAITKDSASMRIDPDTAGRIADEELADLKNWLEKRWHGTPRDTLLL